MLNNDYLVNKLDELLKKSGISARELARRAGIHEVSMYRILNGQRKLNNIDTLYKISKALGVDLNYFFSDSDIASTDKSDLENLNVEVFYGDKKDLDKKYPDSIKIPLMKSSAAATPAIIEISSDDIDGWVSISAENIPKNISERCFAFRVQGNSMEPMLRKNDLVAVLPYTEPPSMDNIIHSNVYLVKLPDGFGSYGLSLKHINVVDDEVIELVSDNKEYANKIIYLQDDGFQVMGRIIWMWREM